MSSLSKNNFATLWWDKTLVRSLANGQKQWDLKTLLSQSTITENDNPSKIIWNIMQKVMTPLHQIFQATRMIPNHKIKFFFSFKQGNSFPACVWSPLYWMQDSCSKYLKFQRLIHKTKEWRSKLHTIVDYCQEQQEKSVELVLTYKNSKKFGNFFGFLL